MNFITSTFNTLFTMLGLTEPPARPRAKFDWMAYDKEVGQ